MEHVRVRRRWSVLLVLLISGCAAPESKDQEQARQAFVAFQSAVKAPDSEKLWNLLDSDSREDAERAAKVIRTAYEKASPDEKAKQEKELGLSSAELAKLTGALFLRSKRFHGKYHEVAGSKIDDISVQGNKATVAYTEEDGDKEKLTFYRQEGHWRVSLAMPK